MVKKNNDENGKETDSKTRGEGKLIPGIILILLGIIFLLNNYGFTAFDIGKLWPLFLLIPGLIMLYNYFNS